MTSCRETAGASRETARPSGSGCGTVDARCPVRDMPEEHPRRHADGSEASSAWHRTRADHLVVRQRRELRMALADVVLDKAPQIFERRRFQHREIAPLAPWCRACGGSYRYGPGRSARFRSYHLRNVRYPAPRGPAEKQLCWAQALRQRTDSMTNPATTSLLDRANLDRDSVRNELARSLSGADDGELFLEYSQTEALMFDNGRLKQATYDTSQGF